VFKEDVLAALLGNLHAKTDAERLSMVSKQNKL
jgi:hypothetical protein